MRFCVWCLPPAPELSPCHPETLPHRSRLPAVPGRGAGMLCGRWAASDPQSPHTGSPWTFPGPEGPGEGAREESMDPNASPQGSPNRTGPALASHVHIHVHAVPLRSVVRGTPASRGACVSLLGEARCSERPPCGEDMGPDWPREGLRPTRTPGPTAMGPRAPDASLCCGSRRLASRTLPADAPKDFSASPASRRSPAQPVSASTPVSSSCMLRWRRQREGISCGGDGDTRWSDSRSAPAPLPRSCPVRPSPERTPSLRPRALQKQQRRRPHRACGPHRGG